MTRTMLGRGAMAASLAVAIGVWAAPAWAQHGVMRGSAAGLSRWGGGVATHHHVHPIHPIHPVRPWPWWGSNVVIYNPNPWGFGNYLYPPTRWDAPQWDGQARDTTPPPAPRQPREPQRPLVMEWNAAKGRAEVVHLDRWDGATAPADQTAPPTAEEPPAPPATKSLNRWDTP